MEINNELSNIALCRIFNNRKYHELQVSRGCKMINKLHTISQQIIRRFVIPLSVILGTGVLLYVAFLYYFAMASMFLIGVLVTIHGFTGFGNRDSENSE